MNFPFLVPGRDCTPLAVIIDFWKGTFIIANGDGISVKRVKRIYFINGPDGEFEVSMKTNFFTQEVKIVYNKAETLVVPPLPVYVVLPAVVPFPVSLMGGALGGVSGGLAMAINLKIVRTSWPVVLQIFMCLVVWGGAFILYLILVTIIYILMHPGK